ncbi:hypothetical protein FW778_00880 [Ginsengibacter hankyongi]|uniref:Lipoprotein n=1 Tax=Ginsengibacter hankyongi TaxID=2607284 RepID=A0A5J5II00_9BACT|nr:DUF6786 family protein [Ginsengibacter hankyongi]KAA9040629.1 hypothetical protein FW778_00880 [Ginsengibacter hankyongi]
MNKLKVILLLSLIAACNNSSSVNENKSTEQLNKGTYGYDVAFLKKYSPHLVQLQDSNMKILVSADYQGRVMTSSATGDSGSGYGWINYNLISSGEKKKQFNPVGGEERFWLGPEGGQYSIYFNKGDSFNIMHWQVPPVVDTETYNIVQQDKSSVTFSKSAVITNYSGTTFNLDIKRKVELLNKNAVEKNLHISIPEGVQYVAYESTNQIKNTGSREWKKDSGLLSIWLLGMMNPTPQTKVVIPFIPGPNAKSYITDNYFGKIPANRLMVKDSVLFFRCDGKSRGKLGLSPAIAKPIVGSYDFKKNVLTILIPEVHNGEAYVNSKWEIQQQPYKGDVINSYNDGPLEDGTQLGPFYEIESSSPARELRPGETQEYHQLTCHFQGDYSALKELAKQLLFIDLDELKNW